MKLELECLQKIMRFRPSLKEVANLFNTSEDTIERRIREWENCTYKEFKSRHSLEIKHRLMDRAMEMAMSGNTSMMIFLLKNIAGFSDMPEAIEQESRTAIPLAYLPLSQRERSS